MAGALKQRWHQRCQAEREEDKMLYQDCLHHLIRVCEVWEEHIWVSQVRQDLEALRQFDVL